MIHVTHNSQDKQVKKKKVCGHKSGTWHVEYGRVELTCRKCGKETSLQKEWHTIPQEYDNTWYRPYCFAEPPDGVPQGEYKSTWCCTLRRHHKGRHKNEKGMTWK